LGLWWHTLCRQSQQRLPWKKMLGLGDRWLPRPPRTPSLSRGPEIRTGCANKRPSGGIAQAVSLPGSQNPGDWEFALESYGEHRKN